MRLPIPLCTPRAALAAASLAMLTSLTACTHVTLISRYDEATDRGLTDLQKASDDFLTTMMANAPSEQNAYEKNQKFYDDMDQQLRRLEFRVGSVPNNDFTKKLVGNIRTVILGEGKCTVEGASLRDLHCLPASRDKGPSRTALQIQQRNINQTIHAALTLELAKKQGLEEKDFQPK